MAKQRFDEIDVVKGIAMLTVLWHHSFILYPINMLDIPWCQHAMNINGTYFMNVFFLVSGYLYAFSRKRTFVDNLKNKAQRLLIPYLSFSAATFGMKVLAPELVNRKVESLGTYFDNLVFRGGELWFVYVLFLIFLVWPWLLQRMNEKKVWMAVAALVVLDVVVPEGICNDIFLYKRVIHYSIFFVTGFAMKNVGRKWLDNNRLFGVLSLLFITFCCVFVSSVKISYVWGYAQAVIGCGFIWMLSYRLVKIKRAGNALAYVGKYSLPYYWLNGFVLVIARTLVVKGFHFESSVAIVLSVFILCVLLETVAVMLIKRIPRVGVLIGF